MRGRYPDLDAGQAVEVARARREDANLDRARANRRQEATESLDGTLADPAMVATALEAMRALVAQLRRGVCLSRYDAGTLRLCAEEILAQLPPNEKVAEASEQGEAVA